MRATAIAALLKSQSADAAEALLDMLNHPSGAHRISALWVVERLGLASVMRRLEEMAEADPDDRVRRRAQRVLRVLPSWTRSGGPAGRPSVMLGAAGASQDQPGLAED